MDSLRILSLARNCLKKIENLDVVRRGAQRQKPWRAAPGRVCCCVAWRAQEGAAWREQHSLLIS